MKHELIICTRDRPAQLRRCLESVFAQTRLAGTVWVVDSSSTDEARRVVTEFSLGRKASVRVFHVQSEPGLTSQRNLGIDLVSSAAIVHFIDDDVVLEPGYFEGILGVFSRDTVGAIGGVGGLITNLLIPRPSRLGELFYLDSRRQGTVLPSGQNIGVYETERELDVDWLPGCSMSFRSAVFEFERFDETKAGYALGEDVDFTYRVRQRFRLVVTPVARLKHLFAPAEGRKAVIGEMRHRYRLVRSGVGNLSMGAFWLSVVGKLAGYAVDRVARRGRGP